MLFLTRDALEELEVPDQKIFNISFDLFAMFIVLGGMYGCLRYRIGLLTLVSNDLPMIRQIRTLIITPHLYKCLPIVYASKRRMRPYFWVASCGPLWGFWSSIVWDLERIYCDDSAMGQQRSLRY